MADKREETKVETKDYLESELFNVLAVCKHIKSKFVSLGDSLKNPSMAVNDKFNLAREILSIVDWRTL